MSDDHFTLSCDVVDPNKLPAAADLAATVLHVERCHVRANKCYLDSVLAAFEAGSALLAAKRHVPHGEWEATLRAALRTSKAQITVRTCQRYMDAAKRLVDHFDAVPLAFINSPSKTTRASFSRLLDEKGLTSIAKVLKLGKEERKSQTPDRKSLLGRTEPEAPKRPDEANFRTPGDILASAIELLGAIDLDPCGSEDPRFHLPARRTIAPPDDSLRPDAEWCGRLLVHPPIGEIGRFAIRTCRAIADKEASQALLLLPADTDAPYMAELQPYPRAFLHRRPTFLTPAGEAVQPAVPYMLVYLAGDSRQEAFANAFGHIADIYLPHRF